jgi:hypothetical protein
MLQAGTQVLAIHKTLLLDPGGLKAILPKRFWNGEAHGKGSS